MQRMSALEIAAWKPDVLPARDARPLDLARDAMRRSDCWTGNQQMGRRWPIGCVALEITQRCNLDCTLCYLSEHSEEVHDIPLEEVFRRIDLILQYYGANTDVQITGGDPTLRKRDELIAIVRRVRAAGLRPTLMTNGRRATRALLEELAAAGLVDVAFHVDTTQGIKGYRNEIELNALRLAYLDRVRGLPLSVMFNTTVHDGNLDEIPRLAAFFAAQAGRVRTASFQAQAATGRGVHEKQRDISLDAVTSQIERGVGGKLNFDAVTAGHPRCNRYSLSFAVNGRLYDALDDGDFIARMQAATAHLVLDRTRPGKVAGEFLRWLYRRPRYWISIIKWSARKAWRMRGDLLAARGRIGTVSFFVHGFMDAGALEQERIHACAFKTMTRDGPVSMCMHNAKRDSFILQPVVMHTTEGRRYWHPLSGKLALEPMAAPPDSGSADRKRAKGRARSASRGADVARAPS